MHLAQANIAIFRWPLEDPRMADFVDQIQPVNRLAERSKGFVWRFSQQYVPRDIGSPWDHPLLFFNMSVWKDADSLNAFIRSPEHLAVMAASSRWLLPVPGPSSAAWPVEETDTPTVDCAIAAITRQQTR